MQIEKKLSNRKGERLSRILSGKFAFNFLSLNYH